MRILFLMAGLPGDAYHGGAVTCWGLLTGFKNLGHNVELVSIYDISASNPYLEYRSEQEKDIEALGVNLIYSEYEHDRLFSVQKKSNFLYKLLTLKKRLNISEAARILPFMLLSKQVIEILDRLNYDFIFCYHFEPLAALYPVRDRVGNVVAGLGDLLHEPAYYRHKYIYTSKGMFRSLRSSISLIYLRHQQMKLTKELVKWPVLVGFFASHYAYFSKVRFNKSIRYFRTPIPVPNLDKIVKSPKFSILHIGELNTTATTLGLMEFIDSGYELLFSREMKKSDVDIFFAGGGEIPDSLSVFFEHSNVTYLGRVYPHNKLFLSADILLVPINVPLGVRIRILTALSFGVVVVAHVANSAGIEELKSGYNCVLYHDSEEMAKEINHLYYNKDYMRQLKLGALQTYNEFFAPTRAVMDIINNI